VKKRTKEELRDKHWSEQIVDKLLEQKKPPFVITGGMTTSGPAHLGTVGEFLYPSIIKQVLEDGGRKTDFYFIGDIFDAFDGIPVVLKRYEKELMPELGKPLSDVIDPMRCHASYGEHYLSEAMDLMKKMGLDITVKRANELYAEGVFDSYAKLFLKNESKVREVMARTSLRKVEDFKNWSPIMPICEDCGRIATTRVTRYSEEEYEYVCDKDVEYTKGCGYKGRARISDHKYKLQWRLHWPSWQAYFNSSIEGSGVDHMTRGGSADTAIAVHKEILRREPPVLFKYGFMLFHGRKYSKSKGIGMGAKELMGLMPPEVLKYLLIAPNLEQNKDIDPTGDKLILVYDDLERLSRVGKAETRPDEKKLTAFRLAVGKLHWKASFTDILLNYQIYRDWGKVGRMLNDEKGVAYLAPYITEWLKKEYEPERYNFSIRPQKIKELREVVTEFSGSLNSKMSDVEIHNLVYEVAKAQGVQADLLFKSIYEAIIGKDKGPRLGKLLASIGVDKAKEMLAFATS
jgi:lysyl-tRNA synthetase class 1